MGEISETIRLPIAPLEYSARQPIRREYLTVSIVDVGWDRISIFQSNSVVRGRWEENKENMEWKSKSSGQESLSVSIVERVSNDELNHVAMYG
jgi:hypothetical protein